MAVDTLVPTQAVPLTREIASLEAITRAMLASPASLADVLAERASEVLDARVALIARPDSDTLEVIGGLCRAKWAVPAAARLLERRCPQALGTPGPWRWVDTEMQKLGAPAWLCVPISAEALLLVGGPERACARPELLDAFVLTARTAIEEADLQPCDRGCSELARTLADATFGVSHRLGNIFAALLTDLHLFRGQIADRGTLELVDHLEQSVEAGIAVARPLRELAVDASVQRMAQVDLGALTRAVLARIRALCEPWPGASRIELRTQVHGHCPAWGDRRRLGECLAGVIFNAMEAAGSGGWVTVTVRSDGRFTEVAVTDDGPGMPGDVRRRAAEPFFSTREARRGLGLTIARGIAVAHRGSLTVGNADDAGALVTVRIPRDPPKPSGAEAFTTDSLATQ